MYEIQTYLGAEEYVTNWQKMKENHMGYLFWGPVGTGKSYQIGRAHV